MTWAAAAASRFHIPAMDVAALPHRAPVVLGVCCVSFAGAKFCGSSLARSKPFACLSVSTDANPFTVSESDSNSPGTKGSRAPGSKLWSSHSGILGSNDVEVPIIFDPFIESNDSGSPSTPCVGNDVEIPIIFYPFAESVDVGLSGTTEYVHIRIQQRNKKKSMTTIQGLRKDFSYERILKDLKKEFCCNGNVVQDKELGKVIQLQGDQRKNVSQFLVNADIVKKEQIKIHGF